MAKEKDVLNMTAEELAEVTRDLEGPMVPGDPISAEERAKFEKARGVGSASIHFDEDGSATARIDRPGPGRPKIGEGAEVAAVSVEAGLLKRAMERAKGLDLEKSEYFTKALELLTDGQTEIAGKTLRAAPPIARTG